MKRKTSTSDLIADEIAHTYDLTPRERDVIGELLEGRNNPEIAGTLGIGVQTVKTHVSVILHKLGIHGRSELLQVVLRTKSRI